MMSEELKRCPFTTREETLWGVEKAKEAVNNMFSTSTAENIIESLNRCLDAYRRAEPVPGIPATDHIVDTNKMINSPLSLDELRGMDEPVWVSVLDAPWIPEGGYYCLCNKGLITPPSMVQFMAGERDWKFYRRKPEGV